ncbi:NDR1/HIN1-like protein 3 [Sesamum indicum]|uniref:NDR1/HIN1-like protein 3 n=1 Tax=Sesamum indicum TaxID=4182 RepID=A0A8M8URZ3_SESIN|nr:NDR1/HIN1-like protein 3 [Sesamum indicum]
MGAKGKLDGAYYGVGPPPQSHLNGSHYSPYAPPMQPPHPPYMGAGSMSNGAYHGTYPQQPPPPPRRQHRSTDDGCCCCCCGICSCLFKCLCGCLFKSLCTCICQIICTLVVLAGIILLIVWLILRPNNIESYTNDASLTEFNLDGNTLRFNLALNISVHNPNSRVQIEYQSIEAEALYWGQRFATKELETFSQPVNSTSSIKTEFKGQNIVMLDDEGLSEYNEEKSSGMFSIDVRLHLHIQPKFLFIKGGSMRPSIHCNTKIPLSTSGKTYQSQNCDVVWLKALWW